tara:strand:+ start:167 stop:304 length:138 start_codon:yes stop_codon:yes gene_type:complete
MSNGNESKEQHQVRKISPATSERIRKQMRKAARAASKDMREKNFD